MTNRSNSDDSEHGLIGNSNLLQVSNLVSERPSESSLSLLDAYMEDTPSATQNTSLERSGNLGKYSAMDYTPSPKIVFLSEEAGEIEDAEEFVSPTSQVSNNMERLDDAKYLLSNNRNTVRQSMPAQIDGKPGYSPWLEFLVKKREEKSLENLKSISNSSSRNKVASNESLSQASKGSEESVSAVPQRTVDADARRAVVSLGSLSIEELDQWKQALSSEMDHFDSILEKQPRNSQSDLKPRPPKEESRSQLQRTKRAETSASRESSSSRTTTGTTQEKTNSQAPGWNIKVWEYSQPAMGTEYKTLFVHPESTAVELLAMILKKWRYLSPQIKTDFNGPRIKVTDQIRDFVERDGWELLHVKRNAAGEETSGVILENVKLADLFALDPYAQISFRRRMTAGEELNTDYPKSNMIEPCYILKLHSQYILPQHPPQDDRQVRINLDQWARRFIILAKNRYLLFFKTDNHARWVHNVLHEIDCSRISHVDKYCATVVDNDISSRSTLLMNRSRPDLGDDVLTPFVVQIKTRTRTILLAVETEEEQERLIKQINNVKRHLARPKITKDSRMQSSKSFEVTPGVSPLQRLLQKVEQTRRVNDIDLPPVEYDATKSEWINWSTQANHSLGSTVRELAVTRLMQIIEQYRIMDSQEFFQIVSYNGNDLMKDKGEGSGMISTMKKMFKGWQPGTNPQGSDGKVSNLFCVPLEELSARYDLTGLGLPVPPPVFKSSIAFLEEKALHTSGIFRIAGSLKRIELLKKAFEKLDANYVQFNQPAANSSADALPGSNGPSRSNSSTQLYAPTPEQIDFTPYTVHDVAGVLKMFLRDLPEPLMTSRLYKAFLAAEKLRNTPDIEAAYLKNLVILLPAINRHLLEKLLSFLHAVAENSEDKPLPPGVSVADATIEYDVVKGNLMNASNLSVVMAPNILREARTEDGKPRLHARNPSALEVTSSANELNIATQELTDSSAVLYVVQRLIERYDEIFKLKDDFIEELKKLTALPALKAPTTLARRSSKIALH